MRMNTAFLVMAILVCIFIQSIAAQNQCQIIVNDGGAAGAHVEVLDGSDRVFWGPTDSSSKCYPDLYKGRPYTVKVKYNGRESSTDITADDLINVWV